MLHVHWHIFSETLVQCLATVVFQAYITPAFFAIFKLHFEFSSTKKKALACLSDTVSEMRGTSDIFVAYIFISVELSLDLQKCKYIMFQVFALLNKLTVIATCLFRYIHFDMQIILFVNSQKAVNYVVSCTV